MSGINWKGLAQDRQGTTSFAFRALAIKPVLGVDDGGVHLVPGFHVTAAGDEDVEAELFHGWRKDNVRWGMARWGMADQLQNSD